MNNCSVCGSPEMYCEVVPYRAMDICAIRCSTCYNFVCAPRSWKEDPFHDAKELWNAQSAQRAAPTQVETQWQPIETAPKDGNKFLAWWTHLNEPRITYWAPRTRSLPGWRAYAMKSMPPFRMQGEPTHWMPIPAAPSYGKCK